MTLKNMKCGGQAPALRNLKFRVASPAQSEALQTILQNLGYDWAWSGYKGTVQFTERTLVYTDSDGNMYSSECERREDADNEEVVDTEAFNERFLHNEDNMKAALANPHKKPQSLEEAYDSPSENIFETAKQPDNVCPWLDNYGEMPVEDGSVLVDVQFRYEIDEGSMGDFNIPYEARHFDWDLDMGSSDIVKWRYHNAEDYFKYPRTKTTTTRFKVECNHSDTITADEVRAWSIHAEQPVGNKIDSHYNFTYTITEQDISAGILKLDPYFVAQQWKLGSKDDSGVLFHCLKTICRFGDKNSREREINALHKSIVRLAQLEGVEL